MTIVEGRIESLKKLNESLINNGISRFHSIGDINKFIKNFDTEKFEIEKHIESEVNSEIEDLIRELEIHKNDFDNIIDVISIELNSKIKKIQDNFEVVVEDRKNSLLKRIIYFPKLLILKSRKSFLQKKEVAPIV